MDALSSDSWILHTCTPAISKSQQQTSCVCNRGELSCYWRAHIPQDSHFCYFHDHWTLPDKLSAEQQKKEILQFIDVWLNKDKKPSKISASALLQGWYLFLYLLSASARHSNGLGGKGSNLLCFIKACGNPYFPFLSGFCSKVITFLGFFWYFFCASLPLISCQLHIQMVPSLLKKIDQQKTFARLSVINQYSSC